MKYYILNEERACVDCGRAYLACHCQDRPEAIVNETPRFQIGEQVHVMVEGYYDADGEITQVHYPVYTELTSWNGAPVIVTEYEVKYLRGQWNSTERTEWFGHQQMKAIEL